MPTNKLRDALARLAEIKALAEKATPGPWQARFIARMFQSARHAAGLLMMTKPEADWTDSEFIAAARTDVPALVEALEEARALLEKAEEELSAWVEDANPAGSSGYNHVVVQIREALGR